jgi:uncharacterized protein YacL (UPF0231 family)
MDIRLYRDPQGLPRAQAAPPHEVVGWWLEQDVQQDPATCDAVLAGIAAVRAGQTPEWTGTGNAHTVTLTARGARIESEFAEPPAAAECSLDELQDAVSRWQALVGRRPA